MKRHILIVTLISVLISACGSASIQNTPIGVQTQTAVPSTSTSSPVLTLTHTLTPTLEPTIPPAIATVLKAQEVCDSQPMYLDYAAQLSPDEQWTSIVCEFDADPVTVISNTISSVAWEIPADFYESDSGHSFGPRLAVPYLWSKDGRYLYFSRYICCIDGPSLFFSETLFGLDRIDLDTGEIENWHSGGSFSFSPDEHYFVYAERLSNTIFINDLFAGVQTEIYLPRLYADIGLFEWNTDTTKMFFVAGSGEWWNGDDGFSLFFYDIEEDKLTELISQDDKRYLEPVTSDDMERFGVDDQYFVLHELWFGQSSESSYWLINIVTGELEPYDTILGE